MENLEREHQETPKIDRGLPELAAQREFRIVGIRVLAGGAVPVARRRRCSAAPPNRRKTLAAWRYRHGRHLGITVRFSGDHQLVDRPGPFGPGTVRRHPHQHPHVGR